MGHAQGQRAPWQRPGAPLDVACWCGKQARQFTTMQIRDGDCGWSCGRTFCREAA